MYVKRAFSYDAERFINSPKLRGSGCIRRLALVSKPAKFMSQSGSSLDVGKLMVNYG